MPQLTAGLLLLALVLLAALVLALVQWRRVRAESAKARQDLQSVVGLTLLMSGSNWQDAVVALTEALVSQFQCTGAAVLAVIETGVPEVLHEAHAPDTVPVFVSDEDTKVVVNGQTPTTTAIGVNLLPVRVDSEVLGVLALRNAQANADVMAVATRLTAVALTGMKDHQRQLALSNTDGLTGLATHRYFQQVLGVALGQAYLEGSPLSIILLDIDHFKLVNDTYGHLLGDLVLREIAYLLRRGLPEGAVAARYGGEEMIILLQGAAAQQADAIAENLRQLVADHEFFDYASGTRLSVTISLGVAKYELGQGKSRLIARADEALYASKRQGRNRATVAQTEDSTSYLFPS